MEQNAVTFSGNDDMKIKMYSPIIAGLLALFCASCAHASQEGTQAPGFSLRDMTGSAITLEQFKGKVVFLDFWAPWCIPCRDELPELDSFYRKFQHEGFIVIGIAVDASAEGVAKFLQKVPVSFPVLVDPKGTVAEAYRLVNLPTGYLIGRDGVIRHRHAGSGREIMQTYEKEITELLK
jgi:peroxiredoxin